MKKKNGFTLIETIATIAFLALIMLITSTLVIDAFNNSKLKAFEYSAKGLLKAAVNYYQTEELTITKPADGYGLVITTTTLVSGGYLKDLNDLDNSVVVLYNDSGDYELYVFASSSSYYVSGYADKNITGHVVSGTVDFETILNGITDFTLDGNDHLTY